MDAPLSGAGGGADWRDAPGKQLGPQAGGRVWGETGVKARCGAGVARGEWTEDVMPQN